MTHNIEELKRQYEQAKNRRVEAENAERERRSAYQEALCKHALEKFEDAGGVLGKTLVKHPWRSSGAVCLVGIKPSVGYSGAAIDYVYATVKKDGTPSKITMRYYGPPIIVEAEK